MQATITLMNIANIIYLRSKTNNTIYEESLRKERTVIGIKLLDLIAILQEVQDMEDQAC